MLAASGLKLLGLPSNELGLLLLLGALVGIAVWGAVDAAQHPKTQWDAIGHPKRSWVTRQLYLAPVGVGAAYAVAYFARIRPQLETVGVVPLMFERILVAIDGSVEGGKTVPAALEMAQRFGSAVTVVHVREHTKYEGSDVDLGPPTSAEELVEATLARFRDAGIDAQAEIRRVSPGDTPQQIVDVAREVEADLIVLGTRGMTEWKSMLLGGVANKVVHHAHCPVLLVR